MKFTTGEVLDVERLNQMLEPEFIQVTYNGEPYSLDNGTILRWDTVTRKKNMEMATNGVQLKAGTTYELEAYPCGSSVSGNYYLGLVFWDPERGASLCPTAYYSTGAGSSPSYLFAAPLKMIYTPSQDLVAQVKVMDNNIGTAIIKNAYNTFFSVKKLGEV